MVEATELERVHIERAIYRAERQIMDLLDDTDSEALSGHLFSLWLALTRFMRADGWTVEGLVDLMNELCPEKEDTTH
jgi:hypothetical protein